MDFINRGRWRWAAIFLIVPGWAGAFDFILSEEEFLAWPAYCQSRYSSLEPGQRQAFSRDFPKAVIEQERARIGQATFDRVHHWCAGMVWLSRARLETNPALRDFKLNEAMREVKFTLEGLPEDSPVMPALLVTLGSVCQEQRNDSCALEKFSAAIAARPSDPLPYSALALLHRKRKEMDLARDILMRGDKASQGQSAELKYNLGLVLLEMGDVNGALEQAHLAYAGGYPLPGLKNKLKRLGRWVEPGEKHAAP